MVTKSLHKDWYPGPSIGEREEERESVFGTACFHSGSLLSRERVNSIRQKERERETQPEKGEREEREQSINESAGTFFVMYQRAFRSTYHTQHIVYNNSMYMFHTHNYWTGSSLQQGVFVPLKLLSKLRS